MAIIGGQINPALYPQPDYSGVVQSAQMQAREMANIGASIGGVISKVGEENKLRKKSEHLNDVRIETIAYIRQQLRIELENLWISKDQTNDDSVRPIKKDVIDTILNCLQVHPVSAPQYRKFLENDERFKFQKVILRNNQLYACTIWTYWRSGSN